ncbi:MAG: thioredoxin domain-containing protein [Thermodesulfobacteriota bacterium]
MDPNQKFENRLIHEKSPYLLQHAHNPVDWHAWGEEVFSLAAAADKPVLLSIGYSTCHWCHVMADESFSDPAVAEIMNRAFFCIKLDREERPDIDHIYITAVSALNGSAGWPLNVFLTPDGRPFFGGTYFPPAGRPGLPSWKDVLLHIERAWNDPETKKKILASSTALTDVLKQHLSSRAGPPVNGQQANDMQLIAGAVKVLADNYDNNFGGFSRAPKFPMPPTLSFLLTAARLGRIQKIEPRMGQAALDMVRHTLKTMADGGIFDQVGGGFHRYATDERWHLPHFEKMLYDNAQLASVYLDAQDLIDDPWPSEKAAEILDYMVRDLMRPEGGFYSAEDADSYPGKPGVGHKKEGAFYGWRLSDVQSALPRQDADIMAYHFGLEPDGNVRHDPSGEFGGINVPFCAHTLAETAARFALSEEEAGRILSRGRDILFAERNRRPRPHLDDKILTSWNGLALTALSKGFLVLGREKYLEGARKTAAFIHENLYDEATGNLRRRWRDGEAGIDGLAEDYIFLVQGLLDLYRAGLDPDHLAWALEISDRFYNLFYDNMSGSCFAVADGHDRHLLFRPADETDNVLPSVSSTAVLAFQRLAALTGSARYEQAAGRLLARARAGLEQHPVSAPLMLAALGNRLAGHNRIVVFGNLTDAVTGAMIQAARSNAAVGNDVLLIDGPAAIDTLGPHIPDILSYVPGDNRPAAWVCAGHTCHPPVSDPDKVRRLLSVNGKD